MADMRCFRWLYVTEMAMSSRNGMTVFSVAGKGERLKKTQ